MPSQSFISQRSLFPFHLYSTLKPSSLHEIVYLFWPWYSTAISDVTVKVFNTVYKSSNDEILLKSFKTNLYYTNTNIYNQSNKISICVYNSISKVKLCDNMLIIVDEAHHIINNFEDIEDTEKSKNYICIINELISKLKLSI